MTFVMDFPLYYIIICLVTRLTARVQLSEVRESINVMEYALRRCVRAYTQRVGTYGYTYVILRFFSSIVQRWRCTAVTIMYLGVCIIYNTVPGGVFFYYYYLYIYIYILTMPLYYICSHVVAYVYPHDNKVYTIYQIYMYMYR